MSTKPVRQKRHIEQLNQAVDNYRKIIASDPNNASAYAGLGECLLKLKQYGDAEVVCMQALALNPKLATAHFILGKLHGYQKRFTDSEIEFRIAIELDPLFVDHYAYLASALYWQGKYQEAEFSLKGALEINPESSLLYDCLASIYRQEKQYSKSVETARRAYQLTPTLKYMNQLLIAVTVNKAWIVGWILVGSFLLSIAFRSLWTIPLAAIPITFYTIGGVKSLKTDERSMGVLILIAMLMFLVLYVSTQINGPVLFR